MRPLPKDCYRFFVTILNEASVAVTPTLAYTKHSKVIIYVFLVIGLIVGMILYYRKKKKMVGSFDKNGMKLIFNGQSEKLSSKETDLPELLAANENQTLEHEYFFGIVSKNSQLTRLRSN